MKQRWFIFLIIAYVCAIGVRAQNVRPDSLVPDSAQQALVDSLDRMFTLQEIVVTAEEHTDKTSASVLQKEAMQHIQPSSFTDILQTRPGEIDRIRQTRFKEKERKKPLRVERLRRWLWL